MPPAPTTTTITFRRNTPVWLKLVVAMAVLIPTMLINGTYTGSNIDVSNYLGILTEDINMAYYAASAGMAVFYPLVPKIRQIVNIKIILFLDLIFQIILSLICAQSSMIGLTTICSFFIGGLKAFALMEMMPIIMPIFSPSNKRSRFYSIYYPFSFSLGQISLALTAWLSYTYQWQHIYYFMIGLLLIALLLVLLCFKSVPFLIKIPFKSYDRTSIILISIFFLSTIYVVTYGKVKDWFSSSGIVIGTILIFLSLVLFIRRQLTAKDPYADINTVLSNRNSRIGYLFMFIVMFFVASGSVVSVYTNSVLRLDSIHANRVYLWMLPGFIIGAAISWYWFDKRLRMRRIVALGLSCFAVSLYLLYFQIHPSGLYENLFIPMVLRGIGMMILYISFGVYVIEGLSLNRYIHNAFFLIGVRSVLGPAVFASLFSNWVYRLQVKNTMVLSETLDMQNQLTASRYSSSLNSALSQGLSMTDAQQTAINSLYNTVQIQAITSSVKTILGYCLIICIVLTICSAFFPFYKRGGIKEAKTSSEMV